MGSRDDAIHFLEAELARSRSVLASLELGRVRSGEKSVGSAEWTDITQREISRLKPIIADLKRLIDQSRAEGGSWSAPPGAAVSGP
jgi:hypothetical protein